MLVGDLDDVCVFEGVIEGVRDGVCVCEGVFDGVIDREEVIELVLVPEPVAVPLGDLVCV